MKQLSGRGSRKDIASSIGFSKYHFSRLFKQYTNYTFCAYLCHRRIKVAEELLVTGLYEQGVQNIRSRLDERRERAHPALHLLAGEVAVGQADGGGMPAVVNAAGHDEELFL